MERDKQIEKLIKEAGMHKAPEGFTESVMAKLITGKAVTYKPLIGRRGWIVIGGLALLTVLIILLLPSGGEPTVTFAFLKDLKMPGLPWRPDLSFLKGLEVSTGVASALVAGLVLVFVETLIRNKDLLRRAH